MVLTALYICVLMIMTTVHHRSCFSSLTMLNRVRYSNGYGCTGGSSSLLFNDRVESILAHVVLGDVSRASKYFHATQCAGRRNLAPVEPWQNRMATSQDTPSEWQPPQHLTAFSQGRSRGCCAQIARWSRVGPKSGW